MATSFLPMFPLNIVVYPGEQLNLHVFEPRYKQLVQECYEKKAPFGIPVFMKNKVSSYGTEVELLSIEKVFPEGEMDIKTRGKRIFTVSDFYRQAPKKLYPGGMIHYMDNINDQDAALQ
ncbi:MAG: LON peptidase substrate-binding domain-containing protein, partial [Chitinophagales bacterium]